MEAFLGIFAGMGFVISVCIAVIVCSLLLGMEGDSPWSASFVFIAAFFALAWMFDVPVMASIKENPWNVLWAVSAYLMIGVLWSIFKWTLTLTSLKQVMLEIKANPEGDPHETTLGRLRNKLAKKGCAWVAYHLDEKTVRLDLKNEAVADKIISWIMVWPFSLINWVLNRFIQDLGRFVFNRFRNVYSNIAIKIMEGV